MRSVIPFAAPLLALGLAGCGSALIPLAGSLLSSAPSSASASGSRSVAPGASQLAAEAVYYAEGGGMLGMRQRVFHEWDADGDDRLSFAEYRAGVLSMLEPPPTEAEMPSIEAQIRARFAKLDADGDGYLSEGEFRLPIRGGRIIRATPAPGSGA